jgi:2,3-dihydroxybiphenyl 1,2-dioxygenase
MELRSLGYIGIGSAQLEDWTSLATTILGMQQVEATRVTRSFRMDDRKQRLVVSDDDSQPNFMGWEVESRQALDALAARLDRLGIAVGGCPKGLADRRFVTDLIAFHDPAGNRIEVFAGPEVSSDPFKPGRPISGFRTGPLGMGHVVLNVESVDTLLPFYRDVLGFRVSDYSTKPRKLIFLHLNSRHHSFAMVESGKRSMHHFMVELGSLDDVGQGYDLSLLEPARLALTLGRHTNDYMTSFYLKSPSGFFIEYGWGGRDIDVDSWVPHETFDGPTLWGHDRLFLPPDQRAETRQTALSVAARGVRAPVPDINCVLLRAAKN